jgi:predicted TIM-barrel fold metal-dependent hydrolase
MIVDCHTHIYEAGRGGPFDLPCSADDLLRQMDEHGVDLSVILPLAGMASNEHVHQQCARFPDRLVGLYNPDFTDPARTVPIMEEFFSRYRAAGLKLHPRLQGVTVNDSIIMEVLHWAGERGLPALFDVFPWGKSLDNPAMHPLAYHRVAQEIPALKLILAHAGGCKLIDAFLTAKSNPNVFLDLSMTPVYFKGSSIAQDCAFLCRRLPPGRLLYGSDFPYVPFSDSRQAAELYTQGLEEESRVAVMAGAAASLFGIRVR